MHTVTWIQNNRVLSVSNSNLKSIWYVYHDILRLGYPVRIWKGKSLVL